MQEKSYKEEHLEVLSALVVSEYALKGNAPFGIIYYVYFSFIKFYINFRA